MPRRSLLVCALLLFASQAHAADEPIGMSFSVSTDGVFSTTVAKAVVSEVKAGSQAERKGLRVGDEVLKVDGVTVPGNGAFTLRPHMKFEPGVAKHFAFKHADGTVYEVDLVKPAVTPDKN